MAATSDEQMNSLLSNFDQIYEDFKIGLNEIYAYRSKSSVDTSKREVLEITNKTLKEENERLKKLYTDSLSNFADQLEHRTKCHNLKEELKRVIDENKSKQHEHRNAFESLRQKHVTNVEELENKIRSLLVEKATNDMVIDRLRQDLTASKSHIQAMSKKLDRVVSEVECKYKLEVQDLKDCLLMEQEEKYDISNKLQSLQKELVISRTSIAEQQRDTNSNRQVETLKQKLMKLRKENEILKRKLSSS
ncbi:PREDICTED: protein At-4/1-like [Camelina sativa]|uniref:Protein At-4/1-like n=1 Tax=Camelina sativa TaxID=90675 RepID=A0ABM0TZ93_CAMSA|nr:PREDICTED: protein At-4/1-like [Camelina sativa]